MMGTFMMGIFFSVAGLLVSAVEWWRGCRKRSPPPHSAGAMPTLASAPLDLAPEPGALVPLHDVQMSLASKSGAGNETPPASESSSRVCDLKE